MYSILYTDESGPTYLCVSNRRQVRTYALPRFVSATTAAKCVAAFCQIYTKYLIIEYSFTYLLFLFF